MNLEFFVYSPVDKMATLLLYSIANVLSKGYLRAPEVESIRANLRLLT